MMLCNNDVMYLFCVRCQRCKLSFWQVQAKTLCPSFCVVGYVLYNCLILDLTRILIQFMDIFKIDTS